MVWLVFLRIVALWPGRWLPDQVHNPPLQPQAPPPSHPFTLTFLSPHPLPLLFTPPTVQGKARMEELDLVEMYKVLLPIAKINLRKEVGGLEVVNHCTVGSQNTNWNFSIQISIKSLLFFSLSPFCCLSMFSGCRHPSNQYFVCVFVFKRLKKNININI